MAGLPAVPADQSENAKPLLPSGLGWDSHMPNPRLPGSKGRQDIPLWLPSRRPGTVPGLVTMGNSKLRGRGLCDAWQETRNGKHPPENFTENVGNTLTGRVVWKGLNFPRKL